MKIWKLLKQGWEQLLAVESSKLGAADPSVLLKSYSSVSPDEVPPPLTDGDYEYLFIQLLEGVHRGWDAGRVDDFFKKLGSRGDIQSWIDWLYRFSDRVLTASSPDQILADRLQRLGRIATSIPCLNQLGNIALELANQLINLEIQKVALIQSNNNIVINQSDMMDFSWQSAIIAESEVTPPVIVVEELPQDTNEELDLIQSLIGGGTSSSDMMSSVELGVESSNLESSIVVDIEPIGGVELDVEPSIEEVVIPVVSELDRELKHKEELYQNGISYSQMGNFESALDSFDKLLAISPEDADIWYNRGVTLFNLGNLAEAIASYDRAIAIKPDDQDAWYNMAQTHKQLGQLDLALAGYNKILEMNPLSREAWFNQAELLHNLNKLESAIYSYDRLLEFDDQNHEIWYKKGEAHRCLGQLEEALISYNKSLELNPLIWDAKLQQANIYYRLNQLDLALEGYNRILEIDSQNPQIWFQRGLVLQGQNEVEAAIKSYDKAIELKLDFYEAWYHIGHSLRDSGHIEQAISSYDRSLYFKKDQAQVWMDRALVVMLSDQADELLTGLNLLTQSNPELNERKERGAIVTYQEALKYVDPKQEGWGDIKWKLGLMYYELGAREDNPESYWNDAINCYYEALTSFNGGDQQLIHFRILQDLLRVLIMMSDYNRAKEIAKEGEMLYGNLSASEQEENSCFNELLVEIRVRSNQVIEGLELAERIKNQALYGQTPRKSPNWSEMQLLLNPATAIIYWYQSEVSLITFICKHNYGVPIILNTPPSRMSLSAKMYWQKQLLNWIKDYHNSGSTLRKNVSLEQVEHLREILNIQGVLNEIRGYPEITNLILIPAISWNNLPLQTLFQGENNLTVTYLSTILSGLLIKN